jgi:class 3 adenylate cyclase/tetratricopeptide (TPR) repeat protein
VTAQPSGPVGSDRGERKLATVLFADLVGSTELAASLDPERVRSQLERFYDAMAEEITAAAGTVEKFAGDAVMAVFGVPAAQEDHIERALHAAIAMGRRVRAEFGDELGLRIGVNAGEVVVGRAREGSSFVSGDTVNVAARLEQAAEPGDILVGERAVATVGEAFEFDEPMRVDAKGKPGGVACRRLLRALSLTRPRGGSPQLRRAFVGRDREQAILRDAFSRAVTQDKPQLVTVMGDAGIGKTRLVRELWDWLELECPAALRRAGRCLPYGHGVTYASIAEILKEHFELLESDPPERILERLGDRRILALTLGLDVAGDLHPIIARDRLYDEWLNFVETLATDRPLALLVEDLHWAEEPLLELLERVRLDVAAPVLLVATARAELFERSPTWGRGRAPGEWIWLEPLDEATAQQLAAELLADEVPASVRELVGRAEGNPFFLEELLGTLIERGGLGDEGWNLSALPRAAGIPDSVHALLAARIDLLPPAEKRALQAAAVIGRSFLSSAVGQLIGGAEPDFRLLEQRDFIRRSSDLSYAGERELVFKHALTREVAYGSLTRRDRAHLHSDLASLVERRGGGRDDEAALLALHYAEAVRPEDVDLAWGDDPERYADLRAEAVRWLRRAVELAVGRYEIDEALALLEKALTLAPTDRERIEILCQVASTHAARFDVQGLRESLEQALVLDPEPSVAAEIYAQLAFYALGRPYMWKKAPEREIAEQWLRRALELAEPASKAGGYALLARAFSEPTRRAQAAADALAVGEAIGEPRFVVHACEAQTLGATEARRYDEACEWADRAIAAVIELRDPGAALHQYWNAGFVYARAGRLAEASRFAAMTERLAASLTAHDEVHAVGLIALLRSVVGKPGAFVELARRAEGAAAANEDFPCQFNWRTLLVCALGLALHGDRREADRLEELGRSKALVAGPAEVEPALLRLTLLRGDLEAIERVLKVLPPTGTPFDIDAAAARLDALTVLGDRAAIEEEAAPFLEGESYTRPFAQRALGIIRNERPLIDAATGRFEAMGLAWRAAETRELLAGQR